MLTDISWEMRESLTLTPTPTSPRYVPHPPTPSNRLLLDYFTMDGFKFNLWYVCTGWVNLFSLFVVMTCAAVAVVCVWMRSELQINRLVASIMLSEFRDEFWIWKIHSKIHSTAAPSGQFIAELRWEFHDASHRFKITALTFLVWKGSVTRTRHRNKKTTELSASVHVTWEKKNKHILKREMTFIMASTCLLVYVKVVFLWKSRETRRCCTFAKHRAKNLSDDAVLVGFKDS